MNDDVLDSHLTWALAASDHELNPISDVLTTVHRQRNGRRRKTASLIVAAVVGVTAVAGSGIALASAFGLFRTVPTHIHVTQPGAGSGGGVAGVKFAQPYTTSLQHAKAVAGFHILTLGDGGTLQSVRVIPPVTRSNGQPVSPREVLKPSIELEYLVAGTTVGITEDPVVATSALQWMVKYYGAGSAHQTTIYGLHLIWQGANVNAVATVIFQTTTGTLVILTSGEAASNGPTPASGKDLSLNSYAQLVAGMS
jgi:hypothetical protein